MKEISMLVLLLVSTSALASVKDGGPGTTHDKVAMYGNATHKGEQLLHHDKASLDDPRGTSCLPEEVRSQDIMVLLPTRPARKVRVVVDPFEFDKGSLHHLRSYYR